MLRLPEALQDQPPHLSAVGPRPKKRELIDILINGVDRAENGSRFFGRDRFVLHDDGSASCPSSPALIAPRPSRSTIARGSPPRSTSMVSTSRAASRLTSRA